MPLIKTEAAARACGANYQKRPRIASRASCVIKCYCLPHHELPCQIANADEIHALGQVGNINLLALCGDDA